MSEHIGIPYLWQLKLSRAISEVDEDDDEEEDDEDGLGAAGQSFRSCHTQRFARLTFTH